MAMEQKMNNSTGGDTPRKDRVFRDIHAKQWYDYGCTVNDYIAKFMFFWIAFNWLYNDPVFCSLREDSNTDRPSEKDLILNLVDASFEQLRQYNITKVGEFKTFEKQAIFNEKAGAPNYYAYRKLCSNNEQTRIRGMFLTLYQVRCNLFHGSKVLKAPHEEEIISSAAVILEGYLDKIIR